MKHKQIIVAKIDSGNTTVSVFYDFGGSVQLFHTLQVIRCSFLKVLLHSSCLSDWQLSWGQIIILHLTDLNRKKQCSIWAMSWQNLLLPYTNNKVADQPAHPCILISTFSIRCLGSIMPIAVYPKFQDLLASETEQFGLSLTWSYNQKTGFLVTRLIYYRQNWKRELRRWRREKLCNVVAP